MQWCLLPGLISPTRLRSSPRCCGAVCFVRLKSPDHYPPASSSLLHPPAVICTAHIRRAEACRCHPSPREAWPTVTTQLQPRPPGQTCVCYPILLQPCPLLVSILYQCRRALLYPFDPSSYLVQYTTSLSTTAPPLRKPPYA